MTIRTHIKAGGNNADNHSIGPDSIIGGTPPIPWRFTIGQTTAGKHEFSPAMSRSAAKEGAALMLQGDESGAREAWGQAVCGWLDELTAGARGALYEAARELARQ